MSENVGSVVEEKFLMIGTIDALYVRNLEEIERLYHQYQNITGISIENFVTESLLQDSSNKLNQTS